MFVQAQGPAEDVQRALQSIPGVVRVSVSDRRGDVSSFDIDSAKDFDPRREVANAIVRGGWGLLELRPMRISLEDIFLKLTTVETESEDLTAEAAIGTGSEGGDANA
jgi:ABC-2 type transport system ATP-binding protein